MGKAGSIILERKKEMPEKSSGLDLAERLHGKKVEYAIHSAGFVQTGEGNLYKISSNSGISFQVTNTQFSFIVEVDKVRNCRYNNGTFSFHLPGNVLISVSIERSR